MISKENLDAHPCLYYNVERCNLQLVFMWLVSILIIKILTLHLHTIISLTSFFQFIK